MATKASDYKHIRSWHRTSGSFEYYIKQQQEKALKEGAPDDALYYSHTTDRWVCMSDLPDDHWFKPVHERFWAEVKNG